MGLKIGIVGTGKVAGSNYVPCLAGEADVSLGYFTRTRPRAEAIAEEYGGEVFASLSALMDWRPDAVFVLTRETQRFEAATALPDAPANAYLHLGQAQCAVGRTEAGRETLTRIERRVPALPADQGAVAGAMIDYFRGLCSQGQVDLARTTVDLVRAGGQAVRELESFIQKAEALPRAPAEVNEAVQDARGRIEVIRSKVRRGAGDDGPGTA